MKILHVHDFFAPGNSRYGFDMDRLLVERGHEVHVLAGVGESGPAEGHVEQGVTFHTYPYGRGLGPWGKYRYALRQNGSHGERLQSLVGFDALILNQPLCAAGILRCPALRCVPKVYSFISPWAEEWRIANPEAGWLRRKIGYAPRHRMEEAAVMAADAVVVESRFIESELLRLHPSVTRGKVRLIPGAVDLRQFETREPRPEIRRRFSLPAEARILLTVRRLVPRMGVDRLVEALKKLPDVHLVVGGEGPLRPVLEEEVRRAGLTSRVRFWGYVRDEDLPSLYAAADLLVLPTRALEGFGLVAIEAMACGTPAAGTPVGAIPEVLAPLDPRLVLPGTSAEELARGLSLLLQDRDLLSSLRARCRRYVEEKFDWRKIIGDLEKILERAGARSD